MQVFFGEVRYTFVQPKQILEIYRLLCSGKTQTYEKGVIPPKEKQVTKTTYLEYKIRKVSQEN